MFKSTMRENVEDLYTPNLWLAIPAEFLGTMVITLLGCGTWVSWSEGSNSADYVVSMTTSAVTSMHVALTFGLAVGTMTWIFNHISGSYFNPALTIAGLITRRLSIIRGILYIIAQIIGAITGAGILFGLSPGDELYTGFEFEIKELGINLLNKGVSSAQGFGVELIVTLVLVFAYFSSHDDKRNDLKGSAPLTIGLTVVACHLFAVRATRCGMNPARSFGPAVIQDSWTDHWVFWVGPIVGAVVAGLMYEYIFAGGATFAGVTKCLLRTKRPRKSSQQEPEKAPLEEVKTDPIDIEESKLVEEEAKDEEAAIEANNDDKAKIVTGESNEIN